MRIYTKTGDQGQTSLIGGARVSKSNVHLEAYGTIDELNSVLGAALSFWPQQESTPCQIYQTNLVKVQNHLFNIGSHLACNDEKNRQHLPQIESSHLDFLEQWIDAMEQDLPPLKNFILPGGHPCAAQIHIGRTVCRRAERLVVHLRESGFHPSVLDSILIYLNRLSDLCFVLARWVNLITKHPDIQWNQNT